MLEIINFNDIAKDTLDEWIYFLKNEEIKDNFSAKGLIEAKQKLDVLKMSDNERTKYESYQRQLHQEASMYQSHYVSGKLDGEKVGVEKGIKKGITKGIEKGREEERQLQERNRKNDKLKIAKKMIQKKIRIEDIIDMTGLTKEEIGEI